jgi:hypothetical protein
MVAILFAALHYADHRVIFVGGSKEEREQQLREHVQPVGFYFTRTILSLLK